MLVKVLLFGKSFVDYKKSVKKEKVLSLKIFIIYGTVFTEFGDD